MSEPRNIDRARWADLALQLFMEETGMTSEDIGDAVADLIADLGHFCDRCTAAGDFESALRRGRENWLEERTEEVFD